MSRTSRWATATGHDDRDGGSLGPGGSRLEPGADSPRLFAQALAELVRLTPPVTALPTLAPPPAWVFWDHDQPGTWPLPDDRDDDLNRYPEPAWLEEVGQRVRCRLAQCHQPSVVGHADWEEPNLRWIDRRLHVVHDWDSLASRLEAAIAGVAAVCPGFGGPGTATLTAGWTAEILRARGRMSFLTIRDEGGVGALPRNRVECGKSFS
jgi:hypothetical protein